MSDAWLELTMTTCTRCGRQSTLGQYFTIAHLGRELLCPRCLPAEHSRGLAFGSMVVVLISLVPVWPISVETGQFQPAFLFNILLWLAFTQLIIPLHEGAHALPALLLGRAKRRRHLGHYQVVCGGADAGITILEEAIKEHETDVNRAINLVFLAWGCLRLGLAEEARERLREAIQLAPNEHVVRIVQGKLSVAASTSQLDRFGVDTHTESANQT